MRISRGTTPPFKAAWVPAGVTTLAFIGIISIGGYLVVRGRLAASVVLSLSQLIGGVLVPIESIPQYIAAWKGAGRVFNELTPLLTEQKPQEETPAALSAHWQTLHLEGLSFRYDEAPVLDDASLTLERGKKYVLMGRSGSGKSTLAKVLAGILPGQFRLTVDGAPEEASALRSHLSYMDQKVFLFQDTVYENISLFRCLDRDTVKEMLRRMRFDPDRMDQDAGEDGALLSGGEKQRVALARELLHQKDILILDECMAAVDQKTARDLEELVLGLDGVTCLLITHQIDDLLLRESDGLLVVENGKITVQAS